MWRNLTRIEKVMSQVIYQIKVMRSWALNHNLVENWLVNTKREILIDLTDIHWEYLGNGNVAVNKAMTS